MKRPGKKKKTKNNNPLSTMATRNTTRNHDTLKQNSLNNIVIPYVTP